MRNSMKKAIAICLVAAISAVTFGCSSGKKENTPKETIDINDTKQELQFFYDSGNAPDSTEAVEDSGAEDSNKEPATEIVTEVVTEVVGTEYVPVTDAAGETVTEPDGAVQTEVQTEIATEVATQVVTVPTEADNGNAYTPSYDTCKAYWLDMTQQGDFTFNGEFLVIEFLINEDTPDGNYPISISSTDIGSWDLVSRVPECIDGEITVGDATPSEQATATDGAFALKVQNAAGNQGDIVKVVVDLENNPGFCGFIVDIQYDAAALKIAKTYGGSDFDAAAVNYLK